MKIHIDFETRSAVDLKKVGAWAYAAHPSTEIMCMAYSVNGEEVKIIERGGFLWKPESMAIPVDTVFVAHNAHFEFAIYHEILVKRFGWPPMEDPMRWDCTLARAAMCNLPISLDACGAALGISSKKDMTGRSVMLKLCRPIGVDPATNKPIYREDPELYAQLHDYCAGDVRAEMEIDKRLPPLPPDEKDIWSLDLLINRRGVNMDTVLAERAGKLVKGMTERLNGQLVALTGGAVTKASRIAEMKRWLETQGVSTISLDKSSVTALLSQKEGTPEIPDNVRAVLDIRRQVGKTSTAKYDAILNVASPVDGRARGLLQYHGASTGRWAGRLLQPHNFPKGVSAEMQKAIIGAIMAEDPELFEFLFDDPMGALSGALRGTIIAPCDRALAVADYSSIEPRVLFWCAGDEKALDMYRRGEDLYIDLARFIYRDPALTKANKKERDVGKMGILGCGYGMGAQRFQAQCATFGIDISESLALTAVRAYRDKYSTVKSLWYSVENAAKAAIRTPGNVYKCCGGRVAYGMDKKREFLCCKLPSGRLLRYFKPRLEATEYGDEIRYQGPGLGGILEEQKTYGGSLVENFVQAIARDIMAHGMLNAELDGFEVVLTVHDELVAEHPLPEGEKPTPDIAERLRIAMCATPEWAAGCPITAEGWAGHRYRK